MGGTKEANRERALQSWVTMRTPEWIASHPKPIKVKPVKQAKVKPIKVKLYKFIELVELVPEPVVRVTPRERALQAWVTMRTPEWLAKNGKTLKVKPVKMAKVKKVKTMPAIPRKMEPWEQEAFARGWMF